MMTTKTNRIVSLFLTLLLFSIAITKAADDNKKRVLHINSYHPSFPTFFQQISGLRSIFDTMNVELDIEFMDSKRFFTDTNINLFEEAIAYKLNNSKPYDLIVTSDDNALTFALSKQSKLFRNTPIVFCGVNNIPLAIAQNQNPNVSGIVEAVSMRETLELMIDLNPEADTLFAIVDATASGQSDLKTFNIISQDYPQKVFSHISLTELTFFEFQKVLSRISEKSPVLLLSAYNDKNNTSVDFLESLKLITDSLNSQLYHLWYHGLGDGIFGGKVISHYEQGQSAALLAAKILTGTDISTIKVIDESPNKYFFDYNYLQKFNVEKSELPKDSTILNIPETFYSRYKKIIHTTIFIIITLVFFILILLSNIYKRHKAEVILRSTQTRQNAMISNISDVIAIISKDGLVRFTSNNTGKLFGWQPSDLINQSAFNIVHSDDLERVKNEFLSLIDKPNKTVSIEYKFRCKDGQYKIVHLTANNLLNDPDIKGILINYHNITERKTSEQALLNMNEEYLALNEELKESLERIQSINLELEKAKEKAVESDKLKSSFLANLSHEIRTPMNGILGFTDLLKKPKLSPEKRDTYIKLIHKSSNYLLSIITDIIEISKIETQQATIKNATIDLHAFMLDIYSEMLIILPKDKDITLDLKKTNSTTPTHIIVDDVKLRQVITNLITNAIKFTDKGKITINYKIVENNILFEVEDSGIGIKQNDFELIFNRFRQVEGETTIKRGGSGLGLAISKAYTEMMGGAIHVESQFGKGSTFKFNIPLNLANTEASISSHEDDTYVPTLEKEKSPIKQKILIAEDDEMNYFFFKEIFSETNYQPERAQNGLEAVKLCRENHDYKFVLMDIKMPIMDGYQAYEQIKQIQPQLPVIAQTAYALSEDEIKLKYAGFYATISKPIKKDELFKIIENIVNL